MSITEIVNGFIKLSALFVKMNVILQKKQAENNISCGCWHGSAGEKRIQEILYENNIPFRSHVTFPNCIDKGHLIFDIYVNNKYIIEFDGI